MTGMQVLGLDRSQEWTEIVSGSVQHDFHHLAAYHALAEDEGSARARLFHYVDGDHWIALPLLLRSVGGAICHADSSDDLWDATSVYGYAGPVASHGDLPEAVLGGFRSSLRAALEEQHVVTLFTRLHPLISRPEWLAGLGECADVGQTVSIDLTEPIDVQRARYRKDYKRQINRLHRLGADCVRDANGAYLRDFADIYLETMQRVEAAEGYRFDEGYFENLVSRLGDRIHLFVVRLSDEVIGAGLFTLCAGIVQAHLVGSRNEYFELSPTKLLFDTVRLWATDQGARVLHLGGGLGGQSDSLFYFKAGFSDRRHEFSIWRWILLPDLERRLRDERQAWAARRGLSPETTDFFPAYRCPTCPEPGCG